MHSCFQMCISDWFTLSTNYITLEICYSVILSICLVFIKQHYWCLEVIFFFFFAFFANGHTNLIFRTHQLKLLNTW